MAAKISGDIDAASAFISRQAKKYNSKVISTIQTTNKHQIIASYKSIHYVDTNNTKTNVYNRCHMEITYCLTTQKNAVIRSWKRTWLKKNIGGMTGGVFLFFVSIIIVSVPISILIAYIINKINQ